MSTDPFELVQAALEAGRIPGAALGVVTGDGARCVSSGGAAQIEPLDRALTRGTWFDLASLTKPIFTTTAILRLVEAGQIGLDEPLTRAIPDLRQYDGEAAERRLTFRQCLAHQTHLPAVEPLYSYGQDPATLRAFILQRAWTPGTAVYSDINFMLLGIALERLTGEGLAALPLRPGLSFLPDPAMCAATEHCTWRGRVLCGEVHDENAFALGGAAGHAGLFGTVDGVLDWALSLMRGELLEQSSLAEIRVQVSATRTAGWEIAHEGWGGGPSCSVRTIGHTGFTGTGLWIDWERRLAWTLLTNRVHPSRHVETGIQALRRATGEAVIAAADAGAIRFSR
jgi:CubicO group peptidase (beta-lactamase class C family)